MKTEKIVVIDEKEKKVEVPSPEGKKEVDEIITPPDDRPEKNWKAELDRKLAAKDSVIDELKQQVDAIRDNQDAKQQSEEKVAMLAKLDDLDIDPALVGYMEKLIDTKVKVKTQEIENRYGKEVLETKKQIYTSAKEKNFASVIADDKTGMLEEHIDDIRAVIEGLDPEMCSTIEGMRNAVGMVAYNVMNSMPAKKVESAKAEPPTVDSGTPAPAKGQGARAKAETVNSVRSQIMGIDDETARSVAKASDDLENTLFSD